MQLRHLIVKYRIYNNFLQKKKASTDKTAANEELTFIIQVFHENGSPSYQPTVG